MGGFQLRIETNQGHAVTRRHHQERIFEWLYLSVLVLFLFFVKQAAAVIDLRARIKILVHESGLTRLIR